MGGFKLLVTIILSLGCVSVQAQDGSGSRKSTSAQGNKKKNTSTYPLIGYNGGRCHFGELGIERGYYRDSDLYERLIAYHFSLVVGHHEQLILAPKLGGYLIGGPKNLAVGINVIDYTNFEENVVRILPEVGLGVRNFKLMYGYHLAIDGKDAAFSNTHNFSLILPLI